MTTNEVKKHRNGLEKYFIFLWWPSNDGLVIAYIIFLRQIGKIKSKTKEMQLILTDARKSKIKEHDQKFPEKIPST